MNQTRFIARLCLPAWRQSAGMSSKNSYASIIAHRSYSLKSHSTLSDAFPSGGLLGIQRCLPSLPLINVCCQRAYNRKKTIKKPPTKPLNFDYAGDLTPELAALDLSEPKPGYEEVESLIEGDDNLKRIFSLEFADGRALRQKRLDAVVQAVQEHPADTRSYEVKIAKDTVKIRNQMRHVLARRKDKLAKSRLIERIWSRHKTLRYLQMRDMEKFNWICKELQVQYNPVPEYNRKLSKRATRKKEARDKFLAVKKEKLADFRSKLEQQKAAFEEHKAKEFAEIEAALKEFGVHKMESLDQVARDLGLGEPYIKKREKKKSRRQQLLELKFELYKNLPKYQTPTS